MSPGLGAGWERYQPTGYQPFTTTGQQAAFTELTQQAKANFAIPQTASSVRDVWTGESPPSQSDLTTLQSRLGPIGGCTGPSVAQPPSYAACTPPAASTGFTSADWTTVINQMLAESFAAYGVVGCFVGPSNSLTSMRQSLFVAEATHRQGDPRPRLRLAERFHSYRSRRSSAPAGRRRWIVELVVAAEPERPRRPRPALGQVLVVALPP